MRRTVLTNADRVVSKNVNIGKLRQRGQSNGSTAIIGKHHEGRTRCAKQSVIRYAIQDCAHPMLANAEADVTATRSVPREIAAVLNVVHCRSVQIGAAADQQRHCLRDWL